MGDVALFSLSLALGVLVPAAIVRRDLRRLSDELLARAWPDASLWCAVVVFGPLCLPLHFIRTRRNLVGVGLGMLWLAAALALVALPVEAVARLFQLAE